MTHELTITHDKLIGVRFGKLTSIAFFQQPEENRNVRRVLCICDCGRIQDCRARDLRKGRKTHCGCLPNTGQFEKKHGHCSNGIISRAWKSWRSMHQRCTQTYNKEIFKTYGARGIKVCGRWAKFENFLADMGEPPEGMTLDRWPNNDGNYEPGNCRWATQIQQARNKRSNVLLTYEGETLTLAEWVVRKNLPRGDKGRTWNCWPDFSWGN